MRRTFSRIRSVRRAEGQGRLIALMRDIDAVTAAAVKAARKEARLLSRCKTISEKNDQARFVIAALTCGIKVTLATVTRLLPSDYHSAGALCRKALELTYALVTVARKGLEGVELLKLWGRKHHASGLQNMIGKLAHIDAPVDRKRVAGDIRDLKAKIPDGDTTDITPAQLANWAGLGTDHDMVYSRLNAYAHFDLFETFQQYSEIVDRNHEIGAWATAGQALVALAAHQIGLYALMARRDLGQTSVADAVEANANVQRTLSGQIEPLLQELGKHRGALAGWLESAM